MSVPETTMDYLGYALTTTGTPLVDRPVTLKRADTLATIASTTTDAAGKWRFDDISPAQVVRAEISAGTTPQVAVKSVYSGDVFSLYVREKFTAAPAALFNLPPLANIYANSVLLTDVLDGRYINTAGDTITGTLSANPGPIAVRGTNSPRLMLVDTDAATNEKVWGLTNTDGDVGLQPWNDAENSAAGDGLFLVRGVGMALAEARLTVGSVAFRVTPTSVMLTGPVMQSGGYAYSGAYNAGGTLYPRAGSDLAVGFNWIAGARDIVQFNTDVLATTSFMWRQLTGASASTELMRLAATGALTLAGGLAVTSGGAAVTGATTVTGQLNVTGYIVSDTALQAPAVAVAGQVNAGSVIATTSLLQGGVLGFYGTAGQAKPTVSGSRGSNAALTSLLSALATLGLIVNSSS